MNQQYQPYPQPAQYQPGPTPQQYGPPQYAPQQQQYGAQPQYQPPQQQQYAATPTGQVFAGFDSMQMNIGNSANYIRPGHYFVKINACKTGSSKKTGGDFSAIEGVVVKVFDNGMGRGHSKGEDVCHFIQKTGPAAPYFKGSICEFIGALLGMPPANVTVEHVVQIFGPAQPMAASCYVGEVKIRDVTTKAQTVRSIPKWVRRVPPAELLLVLDKATQQQYFPNNILAFMAQQEMNAGAGGPVPPEQDWGSKATPDPVMVATQPQAPAQAPQQYAQPPQQQPGQYAPQGYAPAPAPSQAPPSMMPPPGMYRPAPPAGAPMPPAGPQVAPPPQQYGPPPAPPMGPPQQQYGPPTTNVAPMYGQPPVQQWQR